MRIVSMVLSVSLLAGCGAPGPIDAVEPAAGVVAVETVSRDGVEQRAIDAVTAYFDTSAKVAADGGGEPDRIATVVTANWLPEELAGFDTLRALGVSQVGAPVVTRIEVSAIRGIATVSEVVIHACTSLDDVTIRSADGAMTPAPTNFSLVTVYVVPEGGVLKIDGIEPWTDASWCVES